MTMSQAPHSCWMVMLDFFLVEKKRSHLSPTTTRQHQRIIFHLPRKASPPMDYIIISFPFLFGLLATLPYARRVIWRGRGQTQTSVDERCVVVEEQNSSPLQFGLTALGMKRRTVILYLQRERANSNVSRREVRCC